MNRKMIGEAIYLRVSDRKYNPIATKRGNVPVLELVRQIRCFPYTYKAISAKGPCLLFVIF
jgi:hypothetical protein